MKRKEKAKVNPDAVPVVAKPGEDTAALFAQTYLRPTVHAACTVRAYNKGKENEGPEIGALMAELGKQTQAVNGGNLSRAEATLICQAHVLDMIFGNLMRRAVSQDYLKQYETYMRLGLKAQSQCRATLETLALIKNPSSVAFVRQANIAHGPQQVNNGIPAGEASRARESENLQNKQLGAQDGERLDTSTSQATIGTDPQLATVGEINRAEVGKG